MSPFGLPARRRFVFVVPARVVARRPAPPLRLRYALTNIAVLLRLSFAIADEGVTLFLRILLLGPGSGSV